MKKLILLFILINVCAGAFSQPDLTGAKAAYLLAEDSYSKADLKTVLSYLDAASASLAFQMQKSFT